MMERGNGKEILSMGSQWRLGQSTVQGRNFLNRLKLTVSKKSKAIEKYKKEELEFLQQQPETSLKAFTFEELTAATRGFDQSLFLGEGGFGRVYKGFLIDHSAASNRQENAATKYQHVAVKRLREGALQGHREWLNEVSFLGRLRHPNLVQLIGYCAQLTKLKEERLLVYEFVLHGSLENLLFQTSDFWLPMPWSRRVDVAVDAACGVAFLHDHQVINRDIKPSNVLVDHNFVAKLSDFGLARMGPQGDKTHVTTRVLGTWEYAAPEYICTGHLTLQSDIWSFGIVLLELLSGRQAMDRWRPPEEHNLIKWARPLLDQRMLNCLVDPQLGDSYSTEEAKVVLDLVAQCLNRNPKSRPTMKEILRILSSLKESESKDGNAKLSTSKVETSKTSSMSLLLKEGVQQKQPVLPQMSSPAETSLQDGNQQQLQHDQESR